MSLGAERALFGFLHEIDSIETLILEGFDSKFIPTADLRPIYEWAIQQFRISGNLVAPTILMFRETEAVGHEGAKMSDVLEANGIDVEAVPEESVEWAIEELRSRHLTRTSGEWAKGLIEDIVSVPSSDRPGLLIQKTAELVQLSLEIQTKREAFDLGQEAGDIVVEYERRKEDKDKFMGMHLGLPEVDEHTNGLHEGELMIIGAPPKTGKSYFLDRVALKEFEADRSVALFTLENSIEMTRDRIACMATSVNPMRFEAGECTEQEEQSVREWVQDVLLPNDSKLWIVAPALGSRTVESMISSAQIRGVDSLIIDQLTFVDAVDQRLSRPLQIREITHQIKTMISTGYQRMPCLLAHQVTRDGIKVARKTGYLHMDDMAEGSEVERTADWALSMWQSDDARQVNQFLLQTLAARRRGIRNWNVHWDIDTGRMEVIESGVNLE